MLKKYTNWHKLSCLSLYIFLSLIGNERREKPNIPHISDIFIHFNLQFIYLLDENKLDFHMNKAMYKLALDSGGLHLL